VLPEELVWRGRRAVGRVGDRPSAARADSRRAADRHRAGPAPGPAGSTPGTHHGPDALAPQRDV